MLNASVIAELGSEIFEAEESASSLSPISQRYPTATPSDAYSIQQEYARLRVQDGAVVVGHKIGATSRAIQDLFGIDTPDFGHLFDDMLVDNGGRIETRSLVQPMVEPEIGFVLGDALHGPGVEADDVLGATTSIVPCLEIIDSRIHDWRIRLVDTVADNGSSAKFVLGEPIDTATDLITETVHLYRNDEEVGHGDGAAVLGDPAVSAAWLVNALSEFGVSLAAGHCILSGSMTTAIPAVPGDQFSAVFSSIGAVRCSFT